MTDQPVVVVGDRFEEFLANRGTIAASAFLDGLRSGGGDAPTRFVVGQGLTARQLSELYDLIQCEETPSAGAHGGVPVHADQQLTHKHKSKNVTIGTPENIGEGRYRSRLLLDAAVEVLADHLTGQHIPAVTVVEAARQTWTAVTERFLLPDREPRRLVISSFQASFHRFLFPLPTWIDCQVVETARSVVGHSVDFVVEFRQNGQSCASVSSKIQILPLRLAAKQEAMAAAAAVRGELSVAAESSPRPAGVPA